MPACVLSKTKVFAAVIGLLAHPGRAQAEPSPQAAESRALANQVASVFPGFEHTAAIEYKRAGGKSLPLDLLRPKGLNNNKAPLLVYIHGGGWTAGDRYRILRPEIAGVFQRCGQAGIVCASIEYRLAGQASCAYDSAVDCRDALRFLVKNAATYRLDPSRFGTFGSSAGGHLSLVTALGNPRDFPGDPALAGFDPPALRCEVAYYPATDLTDPVLAASFRGPRARLMFGGPPDEKAELVTLLSPVSQIRQSSPPILCFHGDKDTALSVEHSRRLSAKGKAAGADIQYVEVRNGIHRFGNACSPSVEEIVAQASQFIIEHLTGLAAPRQPQSGSLP